MSALKRHLDGKKFAKAKARFMAAENEGEGDLMEEPTLEGEGGAVAGAAEEVSDVESLTLTAEIHLCCTSM